MTAPSVPIKPSLGWLGVAAGIAVLGMVLSGIILFFGLNSLTQGMTQVAMPGSTTLHLKDRGTYTVFYEAQSEFNGKVYSTGGLGAMTCSVKNHDTGEALAVHKSMNASYTINGRSGESQFTFEVTAPGDYDFSAAYTDGGTTPEVIFAVAPGFGGGLVGTVVGSLGACFGSLLIAVVMTIVVLVKRKNMQNRLRLR